MKKEELEEFEQLAQAFIIDFEPMDEREKELLVARSKTLELISLYNMRLTRLNLVLAAINSEMDLKIRNVRGVTFHK